MASPNTAKDKCWDMVTEVTDIKEYLKCSKLQFEKRLNDNLDNIKQCHVSDFVLLKTIGIGAFCRVLLVHHKSDDTKFLAMKVSGKPVPYLAHQHRRVRTLTVSPGTVAGMKTIRLALANRVRRKHALTIIYIYIYTHTGDKKRTYFA